MIGEVLSRVELTDEFFRDVCYEWEAVLSEYFNVPIRKVYGSDKPVKLSVRQAAQKILLSLPALKRLLWNTRRPILTQDISRPLTIFFAMNHNELSVGVGSNCIPILLDAFNDWQIGEAIRRMGKLKLSYVTARDVYNYIKAKSPSSNVHYMPLSISDKYYSENFTAYRNKYIDVCMPGRGNPVLHTYMLRYAEEHNNIKYVYKSGNQVYVSPDGSVSLRADDRAGYMNMIASSRVSLLGCSGIDNAREDTNGICFVSPRFYESAIMGCALLGRYPDNEEFTDLKMRRYCPNITSYEQFCHELERALAQTPEQLYAQNRDFILNSLTSKRAEQIQRDLASLS